jgi:hypothetical protein
MASAEVEGSGFSDRNPDAPLADTAAGVCGVTAPTGAAPAAFLPGDAIIEKIGEMDLYGETVWGIALVFPAGPPDELTVGDMLNRRPFRLVPRQ